MLAQNTLQYCFVLQSSHKVLPSAASYYKARTKYFPVLLRTTKLAQSTSQYCFVLQRSHKVLPSTTSYYKGRTKYFPVLLRTRKLAQSTSQYYFVLQSSHKWLRQKFENRIFTSFLMIEPRFVRKGCDRQLKIAVNLCFWRSNLISRERVATDTWKSQFYRSLWRSNLISCERVAPEVWKSQFYRSLWRLNLISCERVEFRGASLPLPRALREK